MPAGESLEQARTLAGQLAAFPQTCLRNDRRAAQAQWHLDEPAALRREFEFGQASLASGEVVDGAQRFESGAGRHGRFRQDR